MDELLIALFGTSKLEELVVPMFIALAVITGAIFWLISFVTKRRQQRLVDIYNGKLSEHSKSLRQKYVSSRK